MRVVLHQKIRRTQPLDRWNGSTRFQLNGAQNVRTSHYRTVKTERDVDLALLDEPEIAVLPEENYVAAVIRLRRSKRAR